MCLVAVGLFAKEGGVGVVLSYVSVGLAFRAILFEITSLQYQNFMNAIVAEIQLAAHVKQVS